MKISSTMPQMPQVEQSKDTSKIKSVFTEKISQEDVDAIRSEMRANSQAMMLNSAGVQGGLFAKGEVDDFTSFLRDIGYGGKPLNELTQDEAKELIGEDGFFGVKQTSQRIADFVINGANGDEKLLRAGREGMLQGFKEAEDIWGAKLPDISQETMKRALELVDKELVNRGYSILDKEA
ncbi:MAG: hypothetical protein RBS91_01580 [Sulfurimonadaceae bacterium]|nr:hypothetical protein [Sulfurimonadaceae bacterium]